MKKIFTTILAAGLVSVSAFAGNWPGLQGSGTSSDPYLITSAADFMVLADNISEDNTGLGEFFEMTQDIDFGGSALSPVQLPSIGKGSITNVNTVPWGFDGFFDGKNHTISGIYHTQNSNNGDGQFNALFSSIGENGAVVGINFGQNNHVETYNYGGAIASICKGEINRCANEADITVANAFAGGICGQLAGGNAKILNCFNWGDVHAMSYACGIVGGVAVAGITDFSGFEVSQCVNYGDMSTDNGMGSAGIAGSFSGVLTSCTNEGTIDDSAKAGQYTGGIISSATNLVELANCNNYGSVIGTKNMGGICGMIMKGTDAEITVSECSNFGDVTATGANVAGILGNTMRSQDVVTVSRCYNDAEVSTSDESAIENAIGNIRGSNLIAVGSGNEIGAGLHVYPLDSGIPQKATPVNVWGLEGEGTEDSPYLIKSAQDFYSIAEKISEDNTGLDEYFLIANAIDFGGSEASPALLPSIGKAGIDKIASVNWGFEGNLNGNNQEISGIYHNEDNNDVAGNFNALISSLGRYGTVYNIVITEDNYISGYSYTGSVVSLCHGNVFQCVNSADVTSTGAFAGGICGYLIKGVGGVAGCYNTGNVSAMTYAAGIVAGAQSGGSLGTTSNDYQGYNVMNCQNYGDIYTTNNTGAAGIAGSYSGTIYTCQNFGDISGNPEKTTGQYNAGIVATLTYPLTIFDCTNNGNVSGASKVAGIVGAVMKGDDSEIDIRSCVNNGEIMATGQNVAGIVAYSMRSDDLVCISSSSNEASVSTEDADANEALAIGNLRGCAAIALGEENTIKEGLKLYALDPGYNPGTGAVRSLINDAAALKDGKYLLNNSIVIVKNGKIYNVSGQLIQ